MNKTDRIIVAVLFCLLLGWSFYGRKFAPPPPEISETPAVEDTAAVDASPAGVADGGGNRSWGCPDYRS